MTGSTLYIPETFILDDGRELTECDTIDELLESATRLLAGTTLVLSDDGDTITARQA